MTIIRTPSGVLSGKRYDIDRDSSEYPAQLHGIPHAPARIHVLGDPAALRPGLAIVGARKATPYGIRCAERFAQRAALADVCIISGGAVGCDQAAHRGALVAGGHTVVVVGCGANIVYPKNACGLFQEVVDMGGAIVSELPWDSPPLRWAFKKRNRIIAGLAYATLIVEAGLPSGTFSTADAALEQGREVCAVPGSIFSKESQGSNQLIAQGATPIINDETFEDVLNSVFGCMRYVRLFPIERNRQQGGNAPFETREKEGADEGSAGTDAREVANEAERKEAGAVEERTIKALLASPLRPEQLLGIAGSNVIEVIRCLSRLEVMGVVERYRDGRYGVRASHTDMRFKV